MVLSEDDLRNVSSELTDERFWNCATVQNESGYFFEVEEKAADDVEDVHQAQTQHQPPSR